MLHNRSKFIFGHIIYTPNGIFKRPISKPQILPECNLLPKTNIEFYELLKFRFTSKNQFLKTWTIPLTHLTKVPIHFYPIPDHHHLPPQTISFNPKKLKPFLERTLIMRPHPFNTQTTILN